VVTASAEHKLPRKRWSKLGALARGAAISQANRARAKRNVVRWTAVEMKIVMETYPDYDLLQKRLPTRSLSQIKQFAFVYGITSKRHVWTVTEVRKLKQMWEARASDAELLLAFPFATMRSITGAAWHHGFKRPRVRPKLTGHPAIDAIKLRCFEKNYSMSDLDEWCG
jgi:hypothetical protein